MGKDTGLEKIAYISFVLNIISILCFSYKEATIMYSNIIFGINAFLMSVAIVLRNQKIRLNTLHKWLFSMIVWCLISNLWSVNVDNTLTKSWTMIQMFAFVSILYEFFRYRQAPVDDILKAYFIGSVVMSIYGIIFYGVDGVASALFENYRLGEEINQTNVFGMAAAFASFFGMYLYKQKNKKLYLFGVLLSLLMALTSGSTKALFIIVFGIVALNMNELRNHMFISLFCSVVALLSLVFFFQNLHELNIIKRFMQTLNIFGGNGYENTSSLTRFYYMQLGWNVFLEKPILGYGLGNFGTLLLTNVGYSTYAHNNYIEILVDLGIIGFVLYYSMHFEILKKIYKMRNKDTFMLCFSLLVLVLDMGSVTYYSKENYVFLIALYIMAERSNCCCVELLKDEN